METRDLPVQYRVWGADKVAYGPLDLPTLTQWITAGRVTTHTWVLQETANEWKRATELSELKSLFSAQAPIHTAPELKPPLAKGKAHITAADLRRISLFANVEDPQCASLLHYLEVVPVPQFSHLVRQGQHGDAMYVVLEGELRALTIVEGKESILGTIGAGDCFGEISVLDQGPRSADVIANRDSVLLKLSSAAFERLVREAPALAVPFVLALSRAVVQRVRRATKKYEDSIRFIRTVGAGR